MRKTTSGFTIVELAVSIVVVSILATIVTATYNASRTRTQNTARLAELKDWQKAFIQYKVANGGKYPAVSNGGYCLGTGFPSQKCRDYTLSGSTTYTESGSTGLMGLLQTYDPPVVTSHTSVGNTVGPYVIYSTTLVNLFGVFKGSASECPSGTTYDSDDGLGRLLCVISLTR